MVRVNLPTVTPELEEAVDAFLQVTFTAYETSSRRLTDELQKRSAAEGTLRTGGYLATLTARRAELFREHAIQVFEGLLRRGLQAGIPPNELATWLISRIDAYMAGQSKAFVASVEDAAKLVGSRHRAAAKPEIQRAADAVRSDVAQHARSRVADLMLVPRKTGSEITMPTDPRRIAVVHGRNTAARDGVYSFLRALGLDPLEWGDVLRLTGSAAPYVGAALETLFADVQAVVVVLTGDEEVRLRTDLQTEPADADLKLQARPNVLFEAGMAFGLHATRTLILQIGTHRDVSDLLGRHVVRFTGDSKSRNDVRSRLETAGCPVKAAGDLWLSAGQDDIERALAR